MFVRGCLYVCTLLIWCLMQQVVMPGVNNSSTKLAACRSFWSQTVKTAMKDVYHYRHRSLPGSGMTDLSAVLRVWSGLEYGIT